MPQLFLIDKSVGTYPKYAAKGAYVYVTERGKSLSALLDKVWNEVPDGWVTGMSIFAHAGENTVPNERKLRSELHVAGFFLGDIVTGDNVYEFEKLRSLFNRPRSVVCNLLSCSQALDTPDMVDEETGLGFSGKNNQLVKALAISLNQYVRAADAGQVFDTSQTTLDRILDEKAVDFGSWEGTVYLFGPDGSRRRE